jgi:hypothetical protein
MLVSRPFTVILIVLVYAVGGAAGGSAQSLPNAVKPPAANTPMPDMDFYLARGEPGACGRGCSEWIAAEGKIDLQAPQRLRRLLSELGGRRLPIYFHSAGGAVFPAIELGRLIREHRLDTGVGRTIPFGCDRERPFEPLCEAAKQSGQEFQAEMDPLLGICNSSCVWALAGAASASSRRA